MCLVSPQIPIHGLGEPQSEYERGDDVGELCGECGPEVDDGEEVTDDESVQAPVYAESADTHCCQESFARFDSHSLPILVPMVCCRETQKQSPQVPE